MANEKISGLTAVVTPATGDEFAVNQAGTSKKLTLQQIIDASNANAVLKAGDQTMGGSLTIENTQPRIFLLETDAAADEGNYFIRSTNGNLELLSLDDELGGVTTIFRATNAAGVITVMDFLVAALRHNGMDVITDGGAQDIAGIKTFTSGPRVSSSAPEIQIEETDAGSDEKLWGIVANGGALKLRSRTDAGGAGNDAMQIDRTGTVIDSVNFPNGELQSGGNEVITDGPAQSVAGAKTFTAAPRIDNAAPYMHFNEDDQAADGKLWRLQASAGGFSIKTRTDADGAGVFGMLMVRSGLNIESTVFPEGDFSFGQAAIFSSSASYTDLRIGGNGILMSNKNVTAGGSFIQGQNTYYDGTWKRVSTSPATRATQYNGQHQMYVGANGAADSTITWKIAFLAAVNGQVSVGFDAAGAEWTYTGKNTETIAAGENVANAALKLRKDSVTSRSINAAGTINASGADYAEYEKKSATCSDVIKGQIIGFDADGKLTDKWAESISFGIKSTDPAYVGGDTWGSEEVLGASRPEQVDMTSFNELDPEPVFDKRDVDESPYIVDESQFTIDEELTGEERVLAITANEATIKQAHKDSKAAFKQAVQDAKDLVAVQQTEWLVRHDDELGVRQSTHDMALESFETTAEAARQEVDRIAYCGKVPVNVTGAAPGDYVVPVQVGIGIGGMVVANADITFPQHKIAVGKVRRILDDGRSEVKVL